MHPLLIELGPLRVGTYGTTYLVAFVSGVFSFAYLGSRLGIRFRRLVDIGFLVAISGELGARLTFVIVEWPRFAAGSISWRQFLVSGRVVLGGVVAGVAVAAWLFRSNRLPTLAVLDATLAAVPLGMGIGRIGCLLAGCCYGRPTDAWWGITFSDPLAAAINGTPLGVPLAPTQMIQSLDGLLMFALLGWLFFRRRFDGQIAALFFAVEGLSRFAVEFLRGDRRGHVGPLATSQWIGIGMVVAGALLGWLAWRRARLTRATPPGEPVPALAALWGSGGAPEEAGQQSPVGPGQVDDVDPRLVRLGGDRDAGDHATAGGDLAGGAGEP